MEKQVWLTLDEASSLTGRHKLTLQALIESNWIQARKVREKQDDTWMVRLQDCERLLVIEESGPAKPGTTVRELEREEVLDMGIWKTTGKDTVKLEGYVRKPFKRVPATVRFPKARDTATLAWDTIKLDKRTTAKLEKIRSQLDESITLEELAKILDETFNSSFSNLHDQILNPLVELQQKAEDISHRISSKNQELREQFDSLIQENRSLIEQITYLPTPINSMTSIIGDEKSESRPTRILNDRETMDRILLRAKIETLRKARERSLEEQQLAAEQAQLARKKMEQLMKEREELWAQLHQEEQAWRVSLSNTPERRTWWRKLLGV